MGSKKKTKKNIYRKNTLLWGHFLSNLGRLPFILSVSETFHIPTFHPVSVGLSFSVWYQLPESSYNAWQKMVITQSIPIYPIPAASAICTSLSN